MTVSGFIMSGVYFVYYAVYNFFLKRLTCSITINSGDEIFKIVRGFLIQKDYLKGIMTDMKAQLKKKQLRWW